MVGMIQECLLLPDLEEGYTPKSIRNFCKAIGVAKADSTVDYQMLEHFIREDLQETAPRAMAVINPLKLVITNYPEEIRDS